MIHSKSPEHGLLFDSYRQVLGDGLYQKLLAGWQGVMRMSILKCMPVETLAGHFHPSHGRPTKELYSICGLLLIKEFNNWTMDQAVDSYGMNMGVHFALNLEPVGQQLSKRTLESYQKIFIDNNLAAEVMNSVTGELIAQLGLQLSHQRLDSTHVLSNMANFGRNRLLATAVKRFLTQLKRHDRNAYDELDEELRVRYRQNWYKFFGAAKEHNVTVGNLSLQIAQDMQSLIVRFENNAKHNDRLVFKQMVTIFQQRCEVVNDTLVIREKPGGDVIVNPSDPDATVAHKGPGHQIQLSETCSPENEVQLITSALPQTTVKSDSSSLPEVIEDLKQNDRLPEELVADTAYCSDNNVQSAKEENVELLGPVVGEKKNLKEDRLRLSQFEIDEETETVLRCPTGKVPLSSKYDPKTDNCQTIMRGSDCGRCRLKRRCRSRVSMSGNGRFSHHGKERRLEKRRDYEKTDEFAQRYSIRSGIEATNSSTKRRTGLGHLRVRGSPAVSFALLMKITGWNLLRAAASSIMREKVVILAQMAIFALFWSIRRKIPGPQTISAAK